MLGVYYEHTARFEKALESYRKGFEEIPAQSRNKAVYANEWPAWSS